MKTFRLFVASLFITTFFAVSAFGQAAQPASRGIALINTLAFDDAKAGITRYTNAMNTLDKEFAPDNTALQTMGNKYQALEAEIKRLQSQPGTVPVNQTTIQAKIDEYGKLQRDIKFKQEDAKARFESRRAAVLGPVLQDIGKAMQEFSKQKGFILILDAAKMAESGLLLAVGDDKADVTKDFIAYYNARPATAAAATTGAPK